MQHFNAVVNDIVAQVHQQSSTLKLTQTFSGKFTNAIIHIFNIWWNYFTKYFFQIAHPWEGIFLLFHKITYNNISSSIRGPAKRKGNNSSWRGGASYLIGRKHFRIQLLVNYEWLQFIKWKINAFVLYVFYCCFIIIYLSQN